MPKVNSAISIPKKTSPTDWHKADIICGLWKRGTCMQRLSRESGYHPHALSMLLYRPWPKGERIIAAALGVKPHEIWPSRYREDGLPKSKRGERGLGRYKPKHSTGKDAVNVHKQRAA